MWNQALFGRVKLDLGRSPESNAPTDERLQAVKQGALDPSLITLHFNLGRYLLIGSSRFNSMPANLHATPVGALRVQWRQGLPATCLPHPARVSGIQLGLGGASSPDGKAAGLARNVRGEPLFDAERGTRRPLYGARHR